MVRAAGTPDAADVLTTVALSLFLALALATYPVLRWRHPVDFVALVVLAGCGLVGALWPVTGDLEALVQGCVLLAYVWWRIETSTGRERRATLWMAVAVVISGLAFATLTFATEEWSVPSTFGLVFVVIGPAMYAGATMTDRLDLRTFVVNAVVLGVAVVTYMAVYVLVVALLEAAGAEELSLGTAALVGALVALVFAPTQSAMRGVVEELLFGVRLDPLGATSAVVGTLGDDPVVALRAIRESLNLPYAALAVDGVEVAVSGAEPPQSRTFDLDGVGSLVVGLRPGEQRLTATDEQVLRLAVPLLAQTLRARALAVEVQESRGRTIAAVEEERRRLRRDLHDGLGPRLSGVAFTSDAARNLIRTDPATAEEMVAQLRADTVIAIEEIRRMVYAMRPPALDELGLRAGAAPAGRGTARPGRPPGRGQRPGGGAARPARRGRGGGVPDRHRGAGQRGPAQHQPVRGRTARGRRLLPAPRGRRRRRERRLASGGRALLDARAGHRARRHPGGRPRPAWWLGRRGAPAQGVTVGWTGVPFQYSWREDHMTALTFVISMVVVVVLMALVSVAVVNQRRNRITEVHDLSNEPDPVAGPPHRWTR